MNIVIVYNAKSGSNFTKSKLRELVKDTEITVIEWIPIGDGFERVLAPFITAGNTIAVVGGDGTQRAVASLVANTKAVMAPLPGGTLNHFTKDLKVPQDMSDALQRLSSLSVTTIDVASVNGKVYVNNSSVGLYPHSLLEREKTEKILGKWPAALRAAIHAVIRFRTYRITINGHTVRSPFIFIGNNTYTFQKSLLAERLSLNDGVLTMVVLRSRSRFRLVRTALFDRFTSRKRTNEFIIDHPTSVAITSKHNKLTVSLDGEAMVLTTPLEYKIHPKSLKVLV